MHDEHHITLFVCDYGVLMGGSVVQELLASRHCVFGGFSLSGGNRAERGKHGGVHRPAVIKEDSYYLLDEFLLTWGQAS